MDNSKIHDSIKVKKWHSKNCCIEGTKNESYFPTGTMRWGNYAGNLTKRIGNHHWVEMQCNDPDCEFRAVINTNLLSDLIKVPTNN